MTWRRAALLPALLLAGCGYHLVGSGDDAIPTDAERIVVLGESATGQQAAAMILRRMAGAPHHRFVAASKKPHATLHIQRLHVTWRPQGFDSNGIANRYQMQLQGSLWLEDENAETPGWRSGVISVQDEVFATGGPAATESNRRQLQEQLLDRWVTQAIARLRAGF